MGEITFIHTADLHLDSPFAGIRNMPSWLEKRLQKSTFRAFTKLIDEAIENNIDFLIISGDIYDGEDRSVRAQIYFKKEMERLQSHGISVYIIHGNHDHLNGNWVQIALPENVVVFSDQVEVKCFQKNNGTRVNLYGFSYPKRHIHERIIDQYSKKKDAHYHIGLLHGHCEGESDHACYAPFLLSDLMEKDFDYWALGHIHKRMVLSDAPAIIYPGNIQGRHKKENGQKGCYYVKLNENSTDFCFVPTSDVILDEIRISITKNTTFDQLLDQCYQLLEEKRENHCSFLIQLSLELHNDVPSWIDKVSGHELLEILQAGEEDEESFIWIYDLQVVNKITRDRNHYIKEAPFFEELFSVIDNNKDWESAIKPLYNHPQARRYLQRLSQKEQKELFKHAEHLILKYISQ